MKPSQSIVPSFYIPPAPLKLSKNPAEQENYNQQNANRLYEEIDKRIRETYVKEGQAQNQIVLYDMYVRFVRWASDRLGQNGIIAFITNSSFLDARTFDGFRNVIKREFNYAYFIDLGGNVRAISGKDGIFISEKHTVFGVSAMTGIAILFLVKDSQSLGSRIFYANPFSVHELRVNKLKYLQHTKFKDIPFKHIVPDKHHKWINQTENDFDELLPLIDKEVKSGKSQGAVFKKKPKDATIARLFHNYRFADYKEKVIDLLSRVCTVSMETQAIINQMP